MNHKKINKAIKFFVIFILVLGLPSFIALLPSIYYEESQRTSADQVLEDVDYFYENVHSFLVRQTALSEEFTGKETSHMKDVRFLFNASRFLSIIFVLLILSYTLYIRKNKTKQKTNKAKQLLIKAIKSGSIISLIILIVLVFLIIMNFGVSFDVFHRIFFPQGNWLFPSDSLLITLFPQSFFFSVAKKIMFLSLGSIIIIATIFFFLEKTEKKNKHKNQK